MKKKITLKDLSNSLELSISTISKALNDSDEISILTKSKVKKFAKKYNYSPNIYAKNLKKKISFNKINDLVMEKQTPLQLIAEVTTNPELKNCKYSICKFDNSEILLTQFTHLEESKIKKIIFVYNGI